MEAALTLAGAIVGACVLLFLAFFLVVLLAVAIWHWLY